MRKFWLLFPLLFAVVGIHIAYASSEKAEGIKKFRQGRILYQAGRYAESAENFLSAKKEFPVLADYPLYYLSEAYHKLDDHARSLEAIRSLIAKYPSSPLMKKARLSEIREIRENSDADLSRLYEAYVRDYPDDAERPICTGFFSSRRVRMQRLLQYSKKFI